MQSPLHILSARLGGGETPVSGVPLEPYILVRRADGTTVSAGKFFGQRDMQHPVSIRAFHSEDCCLNSKFLDFHLDLTFALP